MESSWLSSAKFAAWASFTVPKFRARAAPIMVALGPSLIMIHGGGVYGDGVVVNTDDQSIVRRLSVKEEFRFKCLSNNCCNTEYEAVVAVVAQADRQYKLVEISTADGSVTVLKDLE